MNKMFSLVLWVIGIAVIVSMYVASLVYSWLLLIAIPLTLLAVTVLFLQMRKPKKIVRQGDIPEDVLRDLEMAERIYEQSNGEIDPHTILWEISKSKMPVYKQDMINNHRPMLPSQQIEQKEYNNQPQIKKKNIFRRR